MKTVWAFIFYLIFLGNCYNLRRAMDNLKRKRISMAICINKSKRYRTLYIGRGILKNGNSSDIYVDYSFNSNELTNISINFEFSTREEQKKFYNELIQKYSTQYGEGEYESYDKDLYQHYTISDSKLIIDSQVAIAYYSRNYVLDQLNKERYLVCLIFIKY